MKLHSRTLPVQQASGDIRVTLIELQQEHDLTDVEMMRVLLEHQQTITTWMLRQERHPDHHDRKADEA